MAMPIRYAGAELRAKILFRRTPAMTAGVPGSESWRDDPLRGPAVTGLRGEERKESEQDNVTQTQCQQV